MGGSLGGGLEHAGLAQIAGALGGLEFGRRPGLEFGRGPTAVGIRLALGVEIGAQSGGWSLGGSLGGKFGWKVWVAA